MDAAQSSRHISSCLTRNLKHGTYWQSLSIGEATVTLSTPDTTLLADGEEARRTGGVFVLLHTARSTVIITLPGMKVACYAKLVEMHQT